MLPIGCRYLPLPLDRSSALRSRRLESLKDTRELLCFEGAAYMKQDCSRIRNSPQNDRYGLSGEQQSLG